MTLPEIRQALLLLAPGTVDVDLIQIRLPDSNEVGENVGIVAIDFKGQIENVAVLIPEK